MTADEILDRIGRVMAERWLEEVAWDRGTFTGFLAHGCPAEYAKVLRDLFGIPLETWPKILRAPRLHPATGNRSMSGSKMELQNAGANRRVKTAATMTKQETPAKQALLDAGLTPQDVADELKVGRSTVNAWCTGTRSIPRRYADRLRAKHKIPLASWAKLAD